MVYLYWLGAFIVVTPLILGLPFLSRNRVYRIATLFAGMSVGIVTLWLFINLLRWGADSGYANEFPIYFTHSLPNLYIASLIIGSTIVSTYYLTTSTRIGAISTTLGSIFGVYFLVMINARLLEILSVTVTEGFPPSSRLSEIAARFLDILIFPDAQFVVLISVSVFIALNGTAAAMRISDEEDSRQSEETE